MADVGQGEQGVLKPERKSRNTTFLLLIPLIAIGLTIGVLSVELKLLLIFSLVLVVLIGAVSPEISLYLIFALILFGFDRLPELVTQGLVLGAGILLLIFSLILRVGVQKRLARTKTPLDILMLFWVLVVAISTGIGILCQNQMRYVLGDLLQFLELPLFFFLTLIIFRTREQVKRLLVCFVGFAFIAALISFLGYLQINPISVAIEAGGVRDRIGSNVVALVPFLLVLIITQLLAFKFSIRRGKLLYLTLLFMTLLFLAVLFFSFTRGYWLGFLVALVFILIMAKSFFRYRTLKIVLVFSLLFFGCLFLGQFFFEGNVLDLFSIVFNRLLAFRDPTNYVYHRYYEVLAAFKAIMKSPLWGIGLGGEYLSPTPAGEGGWVWTHHTHNNYIQIMLRTGFLGMGSFLAIGVGFFCYALRIYKRLNDPKLKALVLGFLATFISAAVTSFTSPLFLHYAITPWLAIIMGLVFVIDKLDGESERSN
jgi:O-antigen ligase